MSFHASLKLLTPDLEDGDGDRERLNACITTTEREDYHKIKRPVMSGSGKNLDNVPFDIFYQIARGLDCDDYVNLSRVNKAIHSLMKNELLARKTVEV